MKFGVGRGLWVMHNGVLYGPIQGQGHIAFEIIPFSKSLSSAIFNGSWKVTADS